jgi:hypothetical protein
MNQLNQESKNWWRERWKIFLQTLIWILFNTLETAIMATMRYSDALSDKWNLIWTRRSGNCDQKRIDKCVDIHLLCLRSLRQHSEAFGRFSATGNYFFIPCSRLHLVIPDACLFKRDVTHMIEYRTTTDRNVSPSHEVKKTYRPKHGWHHSPFKTSDGLINETSACAPRQRTVTGIYICNTSKDFVKHKFS